MSSDAIAHLDPAPLPIPDDLVRPVPRQQIGQAFRDHASKLIADDVIGTNDGWWTLGEFRDGDDYRSVAARINVCTIEFGFEIDG